MNQTNKMQNPESTVPKTPQMNDRDYINDLLSYEKYMTDSYSTALNEASHEALYRDLLSVFNETQNMQRELYEMMFKKGWYALEAEDPQKIQQTYQQFSNYMTQMPQHGPTQ
ncbi:spore coat protein [Bacillus sp. NEB1478]|uniref:spore coat protein n=1 Tax=Bacillus sp. NEB1478 TaxID=3073816 RepID=UPI0028737206|nr:spore coat protein [Bacillus sp. NEB1478]WNB93022.1 spore coat protein [Bacillus sp. NEB1478]